MDSNTLLQQNRSVPYWGCWLTPVDVYNGRKTVVCVVCVL